MPKKLCLRYFLKSDSHDNLAQFKFNHYSPSSAHLIGALKNHLIKFQTNFNQVFNKLPPNFLVHQPTSDHRGEDITHFASLIRRLASGYTYIDGEEERKDRILEKYKRKKEKLLPMDKNQDYRNCVLY